MALLLLFIGGLILVVLSAVFEGFMRRLGRSLVIAACVGAAVGIALAAVFGVDPVTAAIVTSLLTFPVALTATKRRPDNLRPDSSLAYVLAEKQNYAAKTAQADFSFRATPMAASFWRKAPSADDILDAAWTALLDHAQFAAARIGVARRSCSEFLKGAGAQPLDAAIVEGTLLIRKHIPMLVEKCFNECRGAPAAEQRVLLEALITSIEEIAAEAERRGTRTEGQGASEFELARRHVRSRTSSLGSF